jgi:hypothetical protein
VSWRDDSWRDTYDEWKLRSPYDDGPEDECDHEEYEVDILVGRAHCCKCPHSWYQTNEEIAAEIERIRQYDGWTAEQHRRERWQWITGFVRWPIFHLLERIWPRKSCAVLYDDEIPF